MNNSENSRYHEKEYTLEEILDAIPLPLFYKDTEGRYLGANRAFGEFFGQPPEELKGKTVFDIGREDFARIYYEKDSELFNNTGIQLYQSKLKDNEGNVHDVIFNKATFKNRKGEIAGIVGVVQDVTERKKAEREVNEKQRQLETLMSNLPGMVYRCLNDFDWSMIFVSGVSSSLTGYSPSELEENKVVAYGSIIHPEDRDSVWEEVQRSIKEDDNFVAKYRIITKGGQIKWVWEQGVLVGRNKAGIDVLEGYITDITESKKYEDEIYTYKIFMDDAPDAVFWTRKDGSFAYANKTAADRLGCPRDKLQEMTIFDIDTELDEKTWKSIWDNVDNNKNVTIERRHKKSDGTFMPVEVSVRNIEYAGEKLHGSFVRDITQRKKEEEERRILNEQLNQNSKLEAIGRLAGGIAHDFNNMLSVIMNYAELGVLQTDKSEKFHEYFDEIGKAARSSVEITNQLLSFSRKQNGSPRVLNYNDTLKNIINMLSKVVGESIRLEWRSEQDLWSVKIDPSQITQILTNLCVNARDAIGEDGEIVIETRNAHVDENYCNTNMNCKPGDYVMLAVSDNGSGMSKEIQEKIFEPFFTTKKNGEGTGIGMATVYGVVKQNGGFINIYSEPGLGTTFKVYLPRQKEEDTHMNVKARTVEGKGEIIMLVEDEPSVLAVSSKMLEKMNYDVVITISASEAMEKAKQYLNRNKSINLLITDVVMPEMNGKELSSKLTKIHPCMKTLFISGYPKSYITDKEISESQIYFLQKPFTAELLSDKINEVLNDDKE